MAFAPISACNVRIRVDNALGVLTDVSGEGNSWGLNLEHQTSEYKTFYDAVAEDWFRQMQCGRKGDGAYKVLVDPQNTSVYNLLADWWFLGGARTMSVDIPRGAGGVNYEFECVLENFPTDADPGSSDPLEVEFTYKVDGKVTKSTIIS
jgi:hypothetical protein